MIPQSRKGLKRLIGVDVKFLVLLLSLMTLSFTSFADSTRVGDKDALIIIDMQPYFITRDGNQDYGENKDKVKEIIKNQIEVIKLAKESEIPIIFIVYEGLGETAEELKNAAEGYSDAKYIFKSTDGMFSESNKYRSELIDYLSSKEVGNLIILGANGAGCVRESISGSLDNNYNVLAFSKGTADFNSKGFIYPYENNYDFKLNCEACQFKEVYEMESIVLELEKN